MKDLIFENVYAECYEIKNVKVNNRNCLRVYCCQYPNEFKFQIRTYKPITGFMQTGKPRNMIAHLSLSIKEVERILKYMKKRRELT